MTKYDPLRRYLRRRRSDVVKLTFAEIEQIIGGLLPHAAQDVVWWGNEPGEGRRLVQRRAWLEAGFRVASLERGGTVCFERRAGASVAMDE